MAGSFVDKEVASARREDFARRKLAMEAGTPQAIWDSLEFWQRVVRSDGWRESLNNGECDTWSR